MKIANNVLHQSARPVAKPRKVDISRRSLSLQRNNTSIPFTSQNTLYNNSQNHFKSTQNTTINQPNHFKSTQIASINSFKKDPNFTMHRQSTNLNIKPNKNENSTRPKTTIYGQQLPNNGLKHNLNTTLSSNNLTNGKQGS